MKNKIIVSYFCLPCRYDEIMNSMRHFVSFVVAANTSVDVLSDSIPINAQSGGGIDGCLLVEPPTLVLVFIYQARLNAIYTAKLS